MSKISDVFESVYSGMTEREKRYFKTHSRYFMTDTVIAFGGFKEALQYKETEAEKDLVKEKRKSNNLKTQLLGIARNIMNQFPEEFEQKNEAILKEMSSVLKCGFYPDGIKIDSSGREFMAYLLKKK